MYIYNNNKIKLKKKGKEEAQDQKRSKFWALLISSDDVCVCVCVVNNGAERGELSEYVICNGGKDIYMRVDGKSTIAPMEHSPPPVTAFFFLFLFLFFGVVFCSYICLTTCIYIKRQLVNR